MSLLDTNTKCQIKSNNGASLIVLQLSNPSHIHSMRLDFIEISLEKAVLQKNHLLKFSEVLVQHRKFLTIHQFGSFDLNERA